MGNSMFDNYKNIPSSYTPCNMCCGDNLISERDVLAARKPLEAYDALGRFIGFSWNYGNSIVLEFTTTGAVTYDDGSQEDAETYLTSTTKAPQPDVEEPNLSPDDNPIKGNPYNVLGGTTDSNVFNTDTDAPIDSGSNYAGKVFEIKLYNFRYEVVYRAQIKAEAVAKLYIGKETSMLLKPGKYYGSVTLIDNINSIEQTLLDYNTLQIYVKQN